MTDETVAPQGPEHEQPSIYSRLKSRLQAAKVYFLDQLSANTKVIVIVGLVVALATAHLWVPVWWQSFREAVLPAKGQIIVGSPAIYTRQRLVNDRLSQTSWLNEQLKITESADRMFRGIDEFRSDTRSNDAGVRVSVGTRSSSSEISGANSSTTPGAAAKQGEQKQEVARLTLPPIEPTTSDLFQMKNTYREEVRAEIMETQLDDRHDIKGNTIYRLAFDATVLPGTKTDALAVIKVTLTHNPKDLSHDYKELYYDWMRRMQVTVADSIQQIANQLFNRSPDLRLKLTLTEFVLRKLCEQSLTDAELKADIAAEKTRGRRQCDPYQSTESSKMTAARRMLRDFSVEYGKFREARIPSVMALLASNPKTKALESGVLESLAGSLLQSCSTSQTQSVDLPVDGEKTPLQCPKSDSPLEGLNGAIVLYERLRSPAGADVKAAFDSLMDDFKTQKKCESGQDCTTEDLTIAEYNCFAAEYMQASLNTFGHATEMDRRPISTFFQTRVIGRDVRSCNVLFTPEWEYDTPHKLAQELNNGIELYAYSVTPKNLVQRVATALDTRDAVQAALNASLDVAGQPSSLQADNARKRSSQSQRVQSNPIIVGFGVGRRSYSPTTDSPDPDGWRTQFGWAIAPQFQSDRDDKRKHSEKQYSLAALISVPAWWRSVDLKIETCWAERKDLEIKQNGDICPGRRQGGGVNASQADVVRLPGAINELSHKLGFDVVQEPRLTNTYAPHAPLQVETGRPASLLLMGGRIWRSTEVTLGSQKADEIVVLPNMQGILAKFKCVRRQLPARMPAASKPPGEAELDPFIRVPVDIKVWTSEGATDPAFAELVTPNPSPPKVRPVGALAAARSLPETPGLCPDELRDLTPVSSPAPAAVPEKKS